jgi:hypothetical protein
MLAHRLCLTSVGTMLCTWYASDAAAAMCNGSRLWPAQGVSIASSELSRTYALHPAVFSLYRYATLKVSSKAVKGDKDTHEHLADLAKELIKKNKVKHHPQLHAHVLHCAIPLASVSVCWYVQNCVGTCYVEHCSVDGCSLNLCLQMPQWFCAACCAMLMSC